MRFSERTFSSWVKYIVTTDVHDFDGKPYRGVDLLAGGVPCPPFSIAGKQLGKDDERDLFPEAIRLIKEIEPRAVMLENVRGFLDASFDEYRKHILKSIEMLGYDAQIKLLNASDFAVPQLRPLRNAAVFFFPNVHVSGNPCILAIILLVKRGIPSKPGSGAALATPPPSIPSSAHAFLALTGPRSGPPCFLDPPTKVGAILFAFFAQSFAPSHLFSAIKSGIS